MRGLLPQDCTIASSMHRYAHTLTHTHVCVCIHTHNAHTQHAHTQSVHGSLQCLLLLLCHFPSRPVHCTHTREGSTTIGQATSGANSNCLSVCMLLLVCVVFPMHACVCMWLRISNSSLITSIIVLTLCTHSVHVHRRCASIINIMLSCKWLQN